VSYFLLARRSWKQLEAVMGAVQKDLLAQKFDKAIATLQGGFALAPWQFLVASQLHSQIGVLRYVRQDFAGAQPHLEKSFSRHGVARAMLALTRYRKKDLAGMRKVFEDAAKDNKKDGLVFATWAWVEEKEGNHEQAIAVLARGLKANPSDEKLKSAAQALQNDKRLKLGKLYGEQWFQFHLEQMPPQMVSPTGGRGGRRIVYQRR
jgi:tetratricopeptide (TPR) repeat protein